jgi:hypothetical protein
MTDQQMTDLVIFGRVLATASGRRLGGGIAVESGRVAALGAPAAEMHAAQTWTLPRGWIVCPSFCDPHLHILSTAAASLSVDCRPEVAPTIKVLLSRIKEAIPNAHGWVRAHGYDEAFLADRRHPTRSELDHAAPLSAVVLHHRTGHAAVLNSAALMALDIDGTNAGLPMGCDPTTGLLVDCHGLLDRVPRLKEADLARGVSVLSDHLWQAGITSVCDATAENDLARLDLLVGLRRSGAITQELVVMPGIDHLEEFQAAGFRFGFRGDGWRLGHAKIGPTAGSDESLPAAVRRARIGGWPVAIHVLEVETLDIALRALADTPSRLSVRDRLEHVGLCLPAQLDDVAGSGAHVVTNPSFVTGRAAKYHSELSSCEREWLYPVASLVKRGVQVAAASDAPVTGTDPRPLSMLQSAVTRAGNLGCLGVSERVDVETGLDLITRSAFAAVGDTGGTLRTGGVANFVVLNHDPGALTTDRLGEIQVMGTFVRGVPVFVSEPLHECMDVARARQSTYTWGWQRRIGAPYRAQNTERTYVR